MTLQDAPVAYRTYARTEGKSPKTIVWITSSVGYFADFLGPEQQDIGTITGNDLRRFIIALRDKPKFANHPYNKPQQAKLSLQSIETYCRAIRAFFGFLKREAITNLIEKEVATHPYGGILLSFPYFGATAAATIISVVNDINRWPSKKKLKKALGVYSTLRQSGTSAGRGRMGKEGSRHGRRALFQVVFRCIRSSTPDNDFKDYYLRQVAQGKPRLKAVVSTMGKLAEIIYHCLKTGEFYQYQGKYRLRPTDNALTCGV